MSDRSLSASVIASAIRAFEQSPVPDPITRLAIRALVARSSRAFAHTGPEATAAFARDMQALPIALHPDAANAQHYEVPADFFALVLGPQRKYSCCLYSSPDMALEEAEEAALAETARRAGLADGQTILELGCGWGSLSLWMARHFPGARITAVSNSASQRAFIEARATEMGVRNLQVVTADANAFQPVLNLPGRAASGFDRAVSIEMFEHMSNWTELLSRVRTWLTPQGRLFIHIFTHRAAPYRFDHSDPADWIGQYFFTGGIMPSEALIHAFPSLFEVETQWRWSGVHYERTANQWLANFDKHSAEIMSLFEACYGAGAPVWHRRWRLFFLSTAGLFGHDAGNAWGVSHYLLKPAR
ncbi:MAG: cyclopropane-fatty-acyl-phospholipid synthase family protein [Hyphomicrobium sp.]